MKVAPPDEYQNVAPTIMVDWSGAITSAVTAVLRDNAAEPHAVIERLRPFDVTCILRGRSSCLAVSKPTLIVGPECPGSLDMTLGTRSPI
jgi:hypothetical protein